ncbi:MAG: hypothetical protein ACAH11_10800, partial [Sphingomonas sp.]
GRAQRTAGIAFGALALAPALLGLWALQPKPDIGAPALARAMSREGGLWLVDGRAGGEGALIAEAAWADNGEKRVWVSRASQWLSSSDFMGRDYVLTAPNPAAARAVLDRIGAGGIASIAEKREPAYPHSLVLDRAVGAGGYTTSVRRFEAGNGSVLIARRDLPIRPNLALIAQNGGSANVARLSGALR